MRGSSSSSPSGARARLFVAVELPEAVRSALSRWALEISDDLTGLRPLAAESLHVTLCFLGSRSLQDIENTTATCAEAVACPRFVVSLGAAIWLPERRPRVLAVALRDPELSLSGLQSRLSRALEDASLYQAERRSFLAHVTVARVRREHSVQARPLPAPAEVSFPVQTVVLMRSHPGRAGARYEALASFPLPGGEPVGSPEIQICPDIEARPELQAGP